MIERIQTSMLKIHKTNKSKLFIAQTEPSSNLSSQTLPKLTTSSGLPSLKTTSPLTQKKRCELAAYIFKKSLDSLRAKVQTLPTSPNSLDLKGMGHQTTALRASPHLTADQKIQGEATWVGLGSNLGYLGSNLG